MAKGARFVEINEERSTFAGVKVIVDTKTAVQYLFRWDGYAGGMCVLVDQDGKPLLDPQYEHAINADFERHLTALNKKMKAEAESDGRHN